MPAEGVKLTNNSKLLNPSEHAALASFFVQKFGIRKLRLTGGEPLLQPKLIEIVQDLNKLKENGLESIGMTTTV